MEILFNAYSTTEDQKLGQKYLNMMAYLTPDTSDSNGSSKTPKINADGSYNEVSFDDTAEATKKYNLVTEDVTKTQELTNILRGEGIFAEPEDLVGIALSLGEVSEEDAMNPYGNEAKQTINIKEAIITEGIGGNKKPVFNMRNPMGKALYMTYYTKLLNSGKDKKEIANIPIFKRTANLSKEIEKETKEQKAKTNGYRNTYGALYGTY
jgi:hypothetical protein